MTLSSDQFASRGLDAMLIVYSLLDDHPASAACESFIREHTNWFTTTLTLLEAKAVLTKVYAVDANLTSQQLSQFSAGPIEIISEFRSCEGLEKTLEDSTGNSPESSKL